MSVGKGAFRVVPTELLKTISKLLEDEDSFPEKDIVEKEIRSILELNGVDAIQELGAPIWYGDLDLHNAIKMSVITTYADKLRGAANQMLALINEVGDVNIANNLQIQTPMPAERSPKAFPFFNYDGNRESFVSTDQIKAKIITVGDKRIATSPYRLGTKINLKECAYVENLGLPIGIDWGFNQYVSFRTICFQIGEDVIEFFIDPDKLSTATARVISGSLNNICDFRNSFIVTIDKNTLNADGYPLRSLAQFIDKGLTIRFKAELFGELNLTMGIIEPTSGSLWSLEISGSVSESDYSDVNSLFKKWEILGYTLNLNVIKRNTLEYAKTQSNGLQ